MPKTPNVSKKDKNQDLPADFQLLLSPAFAAMSKITDHLFLTGVGGMTKENFKKNHIDYVVNTTTEAPFWEDIDSLRVAVEDDNSANIYPYLDPVVDRIQEVINRNGHVLVHCLAGVSRSASIVIAWLMKYKRMDLKSAFNHCYQQRPVIRPNNGFINQLIAYEKHLFNTNSVHMIDVDVDGTIIIVPHFFIEEHPKLVMLEVLRVKAAKAEQLNEPTDRAVGPAPLTITATSTAIGQGTTPTTTATTPGAGATKFVVAASDVSKRIQQSEASSSRNQNQNQAPDDAQTRQMQAQYELTRVKTRKRAARTRKR